MSPARPVAVARDGRSTDANNIHGLTCPYKDRLLVPVQNKRTIRLGRDKVVIVVMICYGPANEWPYVILCK